MLYQERTSCGAIRPSRTNRVSLGDLLLVGAFGIWMLGGSGCGTTKQHEATAQLLASDSVDMAIAHVDFAPLSGQKVFLDTQFLRDHKSVGFVNAQYVISSLRQQMIAAGVLLHDKIDEADLVVEVRMGTLGTDENETVYGLPQSNLLGAASGVLTAMSQAPPLPGIPEISVARRNDQMSAVKLAMFAYDNKSRERVWQSGMSVAKSTSRNLWIMGVGPFQQGTIHEDPSQLAGSQSKGSPPATTSRWSNQMTAFRRPKVFKDFTPQPPPEVSPAIVELAQEELPAAEPAVVPASGTVPTSEAATGNAGPGNNTPP